MTPLAESLLAAHVEHELSRLRGPALERLIRELVLAQFEWFKGVSLNEVASREYVHGVIQRNVVDLKVSGGITELAGEMANAVFSSVATGEATLAQILDARSYEEFADKIVALRRVHRQLIESVLASSASTMLASRVVSRLAMDTVLRRGEGRAGARVGALIATLGEKLVPGFEHRAEDALADYVEKHAVGFTRVGARQLAEAVDPEWVRQAADEIWDALSSRPLGKVVGVFTPQDLEDFVVLVYEFWLRFRKSPYFREVSREIVDRLFAKYGDESLFSLVQDMGVTEEMVAFELHSLLAPICASALESGVLAEQVRRHLESFYASPRATELFGGLTGAT